MPLVLLAAAMNAARSAFRDRSSRLLPHRSMPDDGDDHDMKHDAPGTDALSSIFYRGDCVKIERKKCTLHSMLPPFGRSRRRRDDASSSVFFFNFIQTLLVSLLRIGTNVVHCLVPMAGNRFDAARGIGTLPWTRRTCEKAAPWKLRSLRNSFFICFVSYLFVFYCGCKWHDSRITCRARFYFRENVMTIRKAPVKGGGIFSNVWISLIRSAFLFVFFL